VSVLKTFLAILYLCLLSSPSAFAICTAEIINLADSFEITYDLTLSSGHSEGAPQSAYSNRSSAEPFQLNTTCPVTVTAVPVDINSNRLTSTTGIFEHATAPTYKISLAASHNDAKIYIDNDTDPLNTAFVNPGAPHSSAHDIIVEVQLGLSVGNLAAGRYNMNIELEIVENL